MEKRSEEFVLNTIRGKVWLGVIALAALNVVWGILAYFATTFSAPFKVSFIGAAIAGTVTTLLLGRWIANEVLKPIAKVSLFAKSLERSPSFSLPKTTGASETDDLLDSLQRNSQQLQNLIGLMDDVAAGRTESALAPLEFSDRLSASFQSLVSRVTDSIDAKKKLDELRRAVDHLGAEVSTIRGGELQQIRSDFPQTRQISDAIRSLINRNNGLVREVNAFTLELKDWTQEAGRSLQTAIENNESRVSSDRSTFEAVEAASGKIDRFTSEFLALINPAAEMALDLQGHSINTRSMADMTTGLRRQLAESIGKVQALREDCGRMSDISRFAQELAKRTRIVALNAAVQFYGSSNPKQPGVVSEIELLPDRAEKIKAEMSDIAESLFRGIDETQDSLQSVIAGMTDFSQKAVAAGDASEELKAFLERLEEFPSAAALSQSDYSNELRKMNKLVEESNVVSDQVAVELRVCESAISNLLPSIENLKDSAAFGRKSADGSVTKPVGAMRAGSLADDSPEVQGEG